MSSMTIQLWTLILTLCCTISWFQSDAFSFTPSIATTIKSNTIYKRIARKNTLVTSLRKTNCIILSGSSGRTKEDFVQEEGGKEKDKGEIKNDDWVLQEYQKHFIKGYLNQHHTDLLISLLQIFSPIGVTEKQKNAFSGGSYSIVNSTIVDLHHAYNPSWTFEGYGTDSTSTNVVTNENKDTSYMVFDVLIDIRGKKTLQQERVQISLDAQPSSSYAKQYKTLPLISSPFLLRGNEVQDTVAGSTNNNNSSLFITKPIDDFLRRLMRLCHIVHKPQVSGKLIQLATQLDGDKVGFIQPNLYLNQVPHNRYVRQYFYDLTSNAILDAIQLLSLSLSKSLSPSNQDRFSKNRMKVTLLFPEMNPTMDSYRIGTLLEVTRSIAIKLAEQNLRVKICVQRSMGVGIFTGIPKQLSGVSTLLERMDWQSGPGEENEGMIGNYVNFGGIGKQFVDNETNKQDDVFLVLCPQSMVGVDSSIIGPLQEMTEAVGDRPIILLNPDLSDKVSSQGQQNIRGRSERMAFADSFETIFHFQNIYISGTSYFPILGAVSKLGPSLPWVAYQRRDLINNDGEVYLPVIASEKQPNGEAIMEAFD